MSDRAFPGQRFARFARWLYRIAPWYRDARTRRLLWWLSHSRAWCADCLVIAEDALPHIDLAALSQRVDRFVGDEPIAPNADDFAGISWPTQEKGCGPCRLGASRRQSNDALRALVAQLNRSLN